MIEYENYVIKRKALTKKKRALVFRRNNLSFDYFERVDGKYIFSENFLYRGIEGHFEIVVEGNNLFHIFDINTKCSKVRGRSSHFGVYLRFQDQTKFPIRKEVQVDGVSFYLRANGNKLNLDDPWARKRKENPKVIINRPRSSLTPIMIPYSIGWGAKHPYRGGGFSPR